MNLAGDKSVKSLRCFAAKFSGVVLGFLRHWLKESLGLLDKKGLRNWNVCFAKNKQHTKREPQVNSKSSSKTNYSGAKVYVGIDVHKKTYTFTAYCNGAIVKRATVPADNKKFIDSAKKWFLGAEIFSCYEAGFSGFKLHRDLVAAGIKNIVVNPASIEVSAKDKKTDKRDSKKMGEQLSVGRLTGIHIPTVEEELARLITRTREQLMKERNRAGHRIKSKLFQFGFINKDDDTIMSEKYLRSVESMNLPKELNYAIGLLIKQWRFLSEQLDDVKIEMKAQSFEDSKSEAIYQSVPGVGDVSARVLSNELGDLSKRFKNQESLFQFVGLTPSEHSSGEKVHKGNIDRQGSARVRKILIECAWRSISVDGVLKDCFERIASTRGKKRAIVAIARKLIGRIRACFMNQTEYCIGLEI